MTSHRPRLWDRPQRRIPDHRDALLELVESARIETQLGLLRHDMHLAIELANPSTVVRANGHQLHPRRRDGEPTLQPFVRALNVPATGPAARDLARGGD